MPLAVAIPTLECLQYSETRKESANPEVLQSGALGKAVKKSKSGGGDGEALFSSPELVKESSSLASELIMDSVTCEPPF